MQILLTDAINQIRDELQVAVLEGASHDIVFTPRSIEIELAITFGTEAKAGGGLSFWPF